MIGRATIYIVAGVLPGLLVGWFVAHCVAWLVSRPEIPIWGCNLIAATVLLIPTAIGGAIGAMVFREVRRQEEAEATAARVPAGTVASNTSESEFGG